MTQEGRNISSDSGSLIYKRQHSGGSRDSGAAATSSAGRRWSDSFISEGTKEKWRAANTKKNWLTAALVAGVVLGALAGAAFGASWYAHAQGFDKIFGFNVTDLNHLTVIGKDLAMGLSLGGAGVAGMGSLILAARWLKDRRDRKADIERAAEPTDDPLSVKGDEIPPANRWANLKNRIRSFGSSQRPSVPARAGRGSSN